MLKAPFVTTLWPDAPLVINVALTRQTIDGQPGGGWFPEERLAQLGRRA